MSDYPGDGEGPPPLFDPGPRSFDAAHTVTSTPTQHAILTYAAEHGAITPIEAGTILHRARGHCGTGAKGGPGDGKSCCPYASSDGLESIKRLIKKGRMVRVGKGVYRLPEVVLAEAFAVPQEVIADIPPPVGAARIARDEAIDRVERNADAEWRDRAMSKLRDLCSTVPRQEFTCDALRDLMGDDEPREPRAYGAIMRRGRHEGICEPLNQWWVSDRVSNHKRPERVWVSAL